MKSKQDGEKQQVFSSRRRARPDPWERSYRAAPSESSFLNHKLRTIRWELMPLSVRSVHRLWKKKGQSRALNELFIFPQDECSICVVCMISLRKSQTHGIFTRAVVPGNTAHIKYQPRLSARPVAALYRKTCKSAPATPRVRSSENQLLPRLCSGLSPGGNRIFNHCWRYRCSSPEGIV